jgi:hypothetical protein
VQAQPQVPALKQTFENQARETKGSFSLQIKLFWLVAFAFLAGIYANMKTLQYANVDT